ncbi:hypothetical protein FWC63_01440 [Candidatus Saccharibacteria bacterium]|nr:hypothetical protein [Candidatus Saccharibacteria bacterium]
MQNTQSPQPPKPPAARPQAPPKPPAPVNPVIQNNQAGTTVTVKEIIEAVNNSQNILVALSKNPSIEELTDVMALTMALDAAGKNATAIFSGTLPESIEFLSPEKVFETDTNSLQDFIISLNKEKADHLRYKVEGDFVKIYITPYRTMLTEQDLQFTRGDFNVDLVIALDVKNPDDFDEALTQHAKIMHSARVASVVLKSDIQQARKFGDIIWQAEVGTLTEAVTEIAEQLNDRREISQDVATALLAGLVSVSDRFMNDKTSPAMMSLAARLMSVGADQRAVMENLGDDDNDPTTPVITQAQIHPATKEALDVAIPIPQMPPMPPVLPPPPAIPVIAPETANIVPTVDMNALNAALAGAQLPPVSGDPHYDAVGGTPDGDPNTLPPPSELAIPKDDIFVPNASIIEEHTNPVGYVDQLTGVATESTVIPPPVPVTPTLQPLATGANNPVAAPVAAAPTSVLPAASDAPPPPSTINGVPTVAELQSLIKNRLPLPPEFDPASPMASPSSQSGPILGFGQPTAQSIKPEIDAIVPPGVAGIKPIMHVPPAGTLSAASAGQLQSGTKVAPPVSTSGAVTAPSVAPPPPANAFKIPAF